MKTFLAFDIDDTIAVTKSPISDTMAYLFDKLLNKFEICVISGGKFEVHTMQIIDKMANTIKEKVARVHVLSTCGTQYYKLDTVKDSWDTVYKDSIPEKDKLKIRQVLEKSAKELGFWCKSPTGEIIEDRDTQITFSALGQLASPEDKYAWDPTNEKKLAIRDLCQKKYEKYEFRAGGTTSIDVTPFGIDKAFGIKKLMELNNLDVKDILFFGDKLQPGGNDYPVMQMGIDCIEVSSEKDTEKILDSFVKLLDWNDR
jgi:HAD superfamily hydrolase (TIGR01484 family)